MIYPTTRNQVGFGLVVQALQGIKKNSHTHPGKIMTTKIILASL